MKKILSIFAAALVAIAVNAAVINITPTSPQPSDNLRHALSAAQDGDEIVMAAGTYVESNSNYIAFDKSVTVRAAEGEEVILQPQVPITITNGAVATIKNIKIDASHLNDLADWYEHVIYPSDETENELHLDGCELYGFNINKSMIYCSSSNKLNVCEINNCYFHNITKSIVFFENTAMSSFSLTNSTVEHITTVTDSYYAGVFDVRSTSGTCTVDHCTFYDVQVMNTDYAAVCKKSAAGQEGMVVSNCIFMLPASQDGIRAIRDYKYANNCLTYNYAKDSNTGIHSGVAKSNCLTNTDPLFVDAANGNYALGEGSPALNAGTDGSNLGDPRWNASEPTHTYTVAGGNTDLFGTSWDPTNEANDMVLQEDNTYKWEMTDITLAAGTIEFKVCEDHAWTTAYPAQNYQLAITEAGIYTIQIYYNPNDNNYVGAVATKTGDAQVDPVVSIAGSMNSWNTSADVMTLAEDKQTASITLNMEAQTYEFKVVMNGSEWLSNAQEFTRENAMAAEMTGNLDNMHLVADVAGEYVFTWTFATNTLAITFPSATAITNTEAAMPVEKVIENGQLIIIKNGVKYNAQGTVVK